VHTQVSISGDEASRYLTLSITTTDRPGLLYRIARAMADHQVELRSARITTLGERVEDTFLVTPQNLSTERERVALEAALLRMLEGQRP
jgi:[protein-PII] uridylyltransferase